MKKVLAIILALVMCASVGMVAFAGAYPGSAADYVADDAVGDEDDATLNTADNTYGANTEVDILVDSTNISVTVPLKYAIVAKVEGGECTVPTSGKYYIQNNSALEVHVVKAEITPNNSNWTLVDTAPAAGTISNAANQLYMTLDDGTTTWNLANGTQTNLWTVEAATSTEEGVLPINITASSSMLNSKDNALSAFIITYTFSATEATTNP